MWQPSMVTISHGHGFFDDGGDVSLWPNETGVGLLLYDLTAPNNDVLRVTGTCQSSGDEYFYAERDITNISSDTYTKYLVRWRTSVASAGLGAQVVLIFTDGSQNIVGATNPEFSTLWTISTGTITAGKTIDKIRLYGNDYPNSVASGAFWVDYDFVMLYKDNFTLPNVADFNFTPPPTYANIPIPGRVGNITQNLGSESATVQIGCDLDIGDWTRAGDYINGEVFADIAHNTYSEPWQWLDTGTQQFKVTLETPEFPRLASEQKLALLFREYRRSNASNETYVERFGLNL